MCPDDRIIRKKNNNSDDSLEAVYPKEAWLCFKKGKDLIGKSMYAEAFSCFQEAIDINPDSEGLWYYTGIVMEKMMRLSDSVKCYDRALEISPNKLIINSKADVLYRLGDMAGALACYDLLLKVNPNDADAWCGKGDVLLGNDDAKGAISAYNKAIGIDPDYVEAWNNMGFALFKLDCFQEAVESYDQALDINSTIEKIWSNKGQSISKIHEMEGKAGFEQIASRMPKKDVELPSILHCDNMPSKDTGMEQSETFCDSNQSNIVSETSKEHLLMGNTLYSMRKYDEAIESYDIYIRLSPENSTAWNNKGLALAKLGKIDDAVICYDKALEINPTDYVVYNNKGSALYRNGDVDEALKCFKLAFGLNKNSKTATDGIDLCRNTM